jgi:hypothetical protein
MTYFSNFFRKRSGGDDKANKKQQASYLADNAWRSTQALIRAYFHNPKLDPATSVQELERMAETLRQLKKLLDSSV